MKYVLCYGDSNTWGYNPNGLHIRYSKKIRYSMVLQELLGDSFTVFEEGQCARTIFNDDYEYHGGNFNGSKHFLECFKSHMPVDYAVIMLGSNDMKDQFTCDSKEAAQKLKEIYVDKVREISPNTQIIIVAPKSIRETTFSGFIGAYNKSKNINEDYMNMAKDANCLFIPNNILETGKDGLHLSKKAHLALANEIYKLITY